MGPRLRVSSERLEKPRIEPTIPGLEGEQHNHYATEASSTIHRLPKSEIFKRKKKKKDSHAARLKVTTDALPIPVAVPEFVYWRFKFTKRGLIYANFTRLLIDFSLFFRIFPMKMN